MDLGKVSVKGIEQEVFCSKRGGVCREPPRAHRETASRCFGSPPGLSLGVTREMDFNALRQEALAATLAAAGENGASALGFHAGAESKLLLARALRGLISAFHKRKSLEKERRVYLLTRGCQQVRRVCCFQLDATPWA